MENTISGVENTISGMENPISGVDNTISGMENTISTVGLQIPPTNPQSPSINEKYQNKKFETFLNTQRNQCITLKINSFKRAPPSVGSLRLAVACLYIKDF